MGGGTIASKSRFRNDLARRSKLIFAQGRMPQLPGSGRFLRIAEAGPHAGDHASAICLLYSDSDQ